MAAVIYAKSNTPEFGAGANTFNEVFGATLNPWDTVALRRRLLRRRGGGARHRHGVARPWHRHGRLAAQPRKLLRHRRHAAEHRPRRRIRPAAKIDRNLDGPRPDGAQRRGPRAAARRHERRTSRRSAVAAAAADIVSVRRAFRQSPKRVAYSPDLGITPVDPEVAAITRKAASRFAEAGVIVEEAHPDLREAHECFHVLRAFDFAISKAALLRSKRDQLKPEVIWNIEEGLKLTVEQLERAEAQRVAMTARTLEFFENYDLLLTPATIVAPFPIENRYVAECAGKKFDNYVEWLGIVYAITLVCCPALSLAVRIYRFGPAGRIADGGGTAWRGAACLRAPRCWKIFWACAAPRRSIPKPHRDKFRLAEDSRGNSAI